MRGAAGLSGLTVVALLPLGNLLRNLNVLIQPVWNLYPSIAIGSHVVAIGPIVLAATLALVCTAACALTGKGEGALLAVLSACVVTVAAGIIGPWAVRHVAAAEGYAYRLPGAPHFTRGSIIIPFLLLAPAAAAGIAFRWKYRATWQRGLVTGMAVAIPAGALAIQTSMSGVRHSIALAQWFPANFSLPHMPGHEAYFIGWGLALVAGAVFGVLGEGFGSVLARVKT